MPYEVWFVLLIVACIVGQAISTWNGDSDGSE